MGGLQTRIRIALDDQFPMVVLALLVVAGLGGWVAYTTHVESGTHLEERPGPTMREAGDYTHRATVVEENPVFPVGTTLENRTVYFTSVSPVLNGSFAYSYTASEAGSLDVSVALDLVIRSTGEERARDTVEYWRISEEVARETGTLDPGQSVELDFSRNVSELAARADRLEGNFSGAGTVETALVAEVQVEGTVNGEDVQRTRTYELPVLPDENTYRVVDPGTVTNTTSRTEQVVVRNSYGPLRRLGAPLLLALSLGLAVGLVAARYNGLVEVPEAERTRLAYRSERAEFDDWITGAHVPDSALEGARIDVTSLEGLVDVAIDTDERVVEDRERGLFVVLDQGRHYVYEPPGTRLAGPGTDEKGQGTEDPPTHATPAATDEEGASDDPDDPRDSGETGTETTDE